MSDHQSMLDKLEEVHTFPTSYTFKVIGESSAEFVAAVEAAITSVLGTCAEPVYSQRLSTKGKHLALTIRVEVPDSQSVIDTHAALGRVEGVRYVL